MATPVFLINNSDGAASDTAASGAGPATALTGLASTSGGGTTVTLDQAPTGVLDDGSHAIYFNDGANRRFSSITGISGNDLTVSPALRDGATGVSYAIGGVRSTIGGVDSIMLLESDFQPGWFIELGSGHDETSSSLTASIAATAALVCVIRGQLNASTTPILRLPAFALTQYYHLQRLHLIKTTSTGSLVTMTSQASITYCIVNGNNTTSSIITTNRGCGVVGNYISNTASTAVALSGSGGTSVANNVITDVVSGVICSGAGGIVTSNLFVKLRSGGAACSIGGGEAVGDSIVSNTMVDCGGDGISYVGFSAGTAATSIRSNLIAYNSGVGMSFGGFDDISINAITVDANLTWNNSVGNMRLENTFGNDLFGTNNVHLDPYVGSAPTDDNYMPNANAAGVGSPLQWLNFPSTENNSDIGASQRPEGGGAGGGLITHPGMTGGIRG